ncbi:Uncharacterised protein [Mycobacteroides abscessus subsp. massiliense]|nr:Uncharacterised protein [Mycobacteroides abscessus subsp. massiliense]
MSIESGALCFVPEGNGDRQHPRKGTGAQRVCEEPGLIDRQLDGIRRPVGLVHRTIRCMSTKGVYAPHLAPSAMSRAFIDKVLVSWVEPMAR